MFTQAKTPSAMQLGPRQSLRQYCPSGTVIFVRDGKASFSETSVWSGDQFLPRNAILGAEDVYVVRATGWITVHAHSATEILLQLPAKEGRFAGFLIRTAWLRLRRYIPLRMRRN